MIKVLSSRPISEDRSVHLPDLDPSLFPSRKLLNGDVVTGRYPHFTGVGGSRHSGSQRSKKKVGRHMWHPTSCRPDRIKQ
jgi:hypothetical protein